MLFQPHNCDTNAATGTKSRVQSLEQVLGFPPEIAAIEPGAKRRRAKQAQFEIHKYRAVIFTNYI